MSKAMMVIGCAAVISLSAPSTQANEDDGQSVSTSFVVLVGFPSGVEAAASGVLLVPGTVIPLSTDEPPADRADASEVVKESLAFTGVVEKLWSTFRLDHGRRIQKGLVTSARVGERIELPAPPKADLEVGAQLLGFSETVATYRVVFRQGNRPLADSTVNVRRGGRAVVGGMDGEAAPYLFVLVEPDPSGERPLFVDEDAGISEPVLVHKVNPRYPKSAKEEGVQGVVIITAVLDERGEILDLMVLQDPDSRLTQAALEAARQWRYEPARRADGAPVAVYFTLTFSFRLQ